MAVTGPAVAQADIERLKKQEVWAASLQDQDCPQLEIERESMIENKDDFVDFDQRKNIMGDLMEKKSCEV